MTSSSIVLVAILKDEERFLDEWLVYHKMIGINHFILYDNDPSSPLKKKLMPHADYITIINYHDLTDEIKPGQDVQLYAYNHAFNNYIKPFNWVVFLDADEFIVLRKHLNIQNFLSEFNSSESSISLNWHMFGHNGFFEDCNGLVTTSLNRRMFLPFPDVKTITRTDTILDITSAHYCPLKYGTRVDANHRIYEDDVYEGKTDVAHINHYYCRSFKTWMRRAERGNVNIAPKRTTGIQGQDPYKEALLLEKFVSIITRDNNEHIDNFMLRYRYDINENLNKLNRAGQPVIDFAATKIQDYIKNQLKIIADLFALNVGQVTSIGLEGKAGMAVFFFHYAKYFNALHFDNLAHEILDTIASEITENSLIDLKNGLIGYGISIEHLAAESFIKIDTNEFLEDIDILINYHFVKNRQSNNSSRSEILETGKYYLSRFNNPVNFPYYSREPKNRQVLEDISSAINQPFKQTLTALDFLCEFYFHRENRLRPMEQIQRSINKTTSIPARNNQEIESFDPLYAAEILFKFSKRAEDRRAFSLTNNMLQHYENDQLTNTDESNKLKIGLRYLYLGKTLDNPDFIKKGLKCLHHHLSNPIGNKTLSANNLESSIRTALIYLLIVADWNERLYELIMLYSTFDTDQ